MDETEDILDVPLETRPTTRPSSFAILSSKVDFIINVILMAAWVFTGLGALLQNDLVIIFALVHFFLGCYQLVSAGVGAIRKQKPKIHYLLGVIFYILFLAVVYSLIPDVFEQEESIYLFLGFLPLAGAIYYTKLSYDTKQKLQAYD